ncbi:MAG: hypothetical protein QXU82_03395 [Candidatus Aenigmatarchaeota archaeon]
MFYVLELEGCPLRECRFRTDMTQRLVMTEERRNRIQLAPEFRVLDENLRCYCTGSMRMNGIPEPVEVEFERNIGRGCCLRLRKDQVTEEYLDKISRYFEAKRVLESDV